MSQLLSTEDIILLIKEFEQKETEGITQEIYSKFTLKALDSCVPIDFYENQEKVDELLDSLQLFDDRREFSTHYIKAIVSLKKHNSEELFSEEGRKSTWKRLVEFNKSIDITGVVPITLLSIYIETYLSYIELYQEYIEYQSILKASERMLTIIVCKALKYLLEDRQDRELYQETLELIEKSFK